MEHGPPTRYSLLTTAIAGGLLIQQLDFDSTIQGLGIVVLLGAGIVTLSRQRSPLDKIGAKW